MKVSFRQAASDDVVRQFRYYLLDVDLPEVAIRFRGAVRQTLQSLKKHPHVGPHYFSSNPALKNLRAWPVIGFEAVRIYYSVDEEFVHIIRILHGKRDVKRILEGER